MSYKIAIASSDRVHLNLHFGATSEFLIYEVSDDRRWCLLEIRSIFDAEGMLPCSGQGNILYHNGSNRNKENCAVNYCEGNVNPKVELLFDCRCILCQKVGFQVQRQLEKKAIVTFDVEGKINAILPKIIRYFYRIDHHQSLKGMANEVL